MQNLEPSVEQAETDPPFDTTAAEKKMASLEGLVTIFADQCEEHLTHNSQFFLSTKKLTAESVLDYTKRNLSAFDSQYGLVETIVEKIDFLDVTWREYLRRDVKLRLDARHQAEQEGIEKLKAAGLKYDHGVFIGNRSPDLHMGERNLIRLPLLLQIEEVQKAHREYDESSSRYQNIASMIRAAQERLQVETARLQRMRAKMLVSLA